MALKGLILDYWLIWLCQITAYVIANHCVILCVFAFRLPFKPKFLAQLANGQLSSHNQAVLSALAVLASLCSLYSTTHHLFYAIEYMCCIY